MKVRGLELPPQLESELRGGRPTLGPDRLAALKPLLTHVDGVQPKLYSLTYIEEVNHVWDTEGFEPYLGTPSTAYPPGDIDPNRALIIGEAEPDSPIALDYRTAPPRVIYLGDVGYVSYWLEIAASYDALVAQLRLNPSR
jgi:hypothetical protein